MRGNALNLHVDEKMLDDLRQRLANTRWTDEVSGAEWDYGANSDYLRELANYWQNVFNWRTQEKALNEWAHFSADIDGLDIHVVHERGAGQSPLLLILFHGWPSSFVLMLKIIILLTDPAHHGGDAIATFFKERPHEPREWAERQGNV